MNTHQMQGGETAKQTIDNRTLAMALVKVVLAVERDTVPSTALWMALDPGMQNLEEYLSLMAGFQSMGFVKVTSETVRLTEKGLAVLERVTQALDAKKNSGVKVGF